MVDQFDDDDNAPPDDLPTVAYVMFIIASCVLLVCLFVFSIAYLITSVVIAVSGPISLMDSFETTPSILTPYFVIISAGAVYITYLTIFWSYHRRLSKISLYILIAVGGAAIPVAVSASHYFNYRRSPVDYVIPAEKLPYLRGLGASSLRQTQVAYRRLQDSRELIRLLLARRASLPTRLPFVDGPPSTGVCSRLDLGPQTGAVCVGRTFVFIPPIAGEGPSNRPVAVEQPEVWLNPRLRVTADSLDLVVLFATPMFHCPVLPAIYAPSDGRGSGADTGQLLRCLLVAQRAIEARMQMHRQVLDRAPDHPDISYWVIFLDSLAGIVGADYSVLEPVSPLAGFVSVTGSILSWAYFAVFASLILEAVSAKNKRPKNPTGG